MADRALREWPQWAIEALGPVPDDETARAEWAHSAGWAASYRELAGHTDPADPLGAAPPAGLAEKHAVFRAAHDALDLPGAGADEEAMTEGQLRARVAAYTREEVWAPRYVAEELAATHEALRRREADTTVWTARAEAETDPHEAAQLRAAADTARTEAEQLAGQVAQLEQADAARAVWWVETAVTRDNAERARVALGIRGITLDDPTEQVTTQEWMTAQRAAEAEADAERDIHEHDLTDHSVDEAAARVDADLVVEPAPVDIRDDATPDANEHTDPVEQRRVPLPDETAAAVARAHTARAEIARRAEAEARAAAHAAEVEPEEDARRAELARWADEDTDTDGQADQHGGGREPDEEFVRER